MNNFFNNFFLESNLFKKNLTSKNDYIDNRNYAYQAYLQYLKDKSYQKSEEELMRFLILKNILHSHYGL